MHKDTDFCPIAEYVKNYLTKPFLRKRMKGKKREVGTYQYVSWYGGIESIYHNTIFNLRYSSLPINDRIWNHPQAVIFFISCTSKRI